MFVQGMNHLLISSWYLAGIYGSRFLEFDCVWLCSRFLAFIVQFVAIKLNYMISKIDA